MEQKLFWEVPSISLCPQICLLLSPRLISTPAQPMSQALSAFPIVQIYILYFLCCCCSHGEIISCTRYSVALFQNLPGDFPLGVTCSKKWYFGGSISPQCCQGLPLLVASYLNCLLKLNCHIWGTLWIQNVNKTLQSSPCSVTSLPRHCSYRNSNSEQ